MKSRRLIPLKNLADSDFGGSLLKNSHAKCSRPFSPRAAIHVVMRARTPYSLLKKGRRDRIAAIVSEHAKRQQVQVHRFANAGNHLHFLIECREKKKFQGFLRAVSGAIALFVKLEERSRKTVSLAATALKNGLWIQRPWTRLVATSGRAFTAAWRYVHLNEIEGDCWGMTRAEASAILYGDIGPPRPWIKVRPPVVRGAR